VPADIGPSNRLATRRPNPSRDGVAVSFRLLEASAVRLDVYDVLGRRVASLVDGPMPAGTHRVAWDGEGVSAGLYVVRLTTPVRSAVTTAVRLR
jgi:hypothetical protein